MIKSMTGYGRAQAIEEGKNILVEIKSVNHRYFDFSCRIPRAFGFLEEKLKADVCAFTSRGKVDVYVSVDLTQSGALDVKVNTKLLESYLHAFAQIKDDYQLAGDISVMGVSRIPDICLVEREEVDEDALWLDIKKVLKQAAKGFVEMREREGQKLYDDLTGRGKCILQLVDKIELRTPEIEAEYQRRLTERIEQMTTNGIDENRILTEVAIFAEKLSITEEIVRLRSHFSQYFSMLVAQEPTGRKLDFLMQEMNREVNTIGSKSSDIDITRIVVDIKSELEKIREQVQNIE